MPNRPPTKGDLWELRDEVIHLTEAHERLTEAQRRTKKATVVQYIIIALLSVALIGTGVVAVIAVNAADEARRALVINCENNNDSRENQRLAWNFVIDVSEGDGNNSAGEIEALEAMREWFNAVFMQRDCTDLDRKYVIPVPPDVKELMKSVQKED